MIKNNIREEFDELKLGSKRLENRLKRTFENMSKDPDKSLWLSSGSRSEAKAAYRMLGNEKLELEKVIEAHAKKTVKRIREFKVKKILVVQDTTGVNYGGHKKTKGMGYFCDKVLGINIHSSIAMTEEGIVLGLLNQSSNTREVNKDDTMSKDKKKKRPIEEKESYKWIEGIDKSSNYIPEDIEVINICDREGDIYELFEKCTIENSKFLIRVVQNRLTVDNEKIIDEIKKTQAEGRVKVLIPRDSRNNKLEREAELNISYKEFELKKPKILGNVKDIEETIKVTVIYVKEEVKDGISEPIEWILITNNKVKNIGDAFQQIKYYIQRWKIERFHYVLKSGCNIEKIQERSVDKIVMLIFLYSIIAIFILNLTYLARIYKELECDKIFDESEWKLLYCCGKKTREEPKRAYTLEEAVRYIAKLGGFKGSKSDGEPGVKVIWIGLGKLYTLLEYRQYIIEDKKHI